MAQPPWLRIDGARQNNLKNVSVAIPHDRVTVITGVSGSGKSSLAFDIRVRGASGLRPDLPVLRTWTGFRILGTARDLTDGHTPNAYLPDDLKAVFEVAYITGWCVKSEILTRHWSHVDFHSGWIRLEPGETKNSEGRQFPLTPDLRAALERQGGRTRAGEDATDTIIPWMFHRSGKPIKSFRRAWVTVCTKAGIPGRLPHDFRRSAVRNLERAGGPRSTAMKMVGHRTEGIYRRYAIVDEAMLKEGAAKLQILHDMQQPLGKNVVGRDGIDPPTPGFSDLIVDRSHCPCSQRLTRSLARGRRCGEWRPAAPCRAA